MGDDPIAQVRAFLAEHDPDVLAAVADVDRGLIGNMLELSPMERLHRAVQTAYELDAMAARGEITDSKTLFALQWLQRWRSGAWPLQWGAA